MISAIIYTLYRKCKVMAVKLEIFCLFYFITLVAAQVNKVQINVTSPVQVDVDEFEITCHAEGSYHHIFSYAIHKNGSSGWSPVVRQYYTVGSITSMVKTEWFLSSFESRATLSGTPLPSPLATMKMTIPANKANMATDAAEYQCDFVATQRSGNYPITHSDVAYIEILPGPTGHSSSKTTTPTSTAGHRLSFGRLNFASQRVLKVGRTLREIAYMSSLQLAKKRLFSCALIMLLKLFHISICVLLGPLHLAVVFVWSPYSEETIISTIVRSSRSLVNPTSGSVEHTQSG